MPTRAGWGSRGLLAGPERPEGAPLSRSPLFLDQCIHSVSLHSSEQTGGKSQQSSPPQQFISSSLRPCPSLRMQLFHCAFLFPKYLWNYTDWLAHAAFDDSATKTEPKRRQGHFMLLQPGIDSHFRFCFPAPSLSASSQNQNKSLQPVIHLWLIHLIWQTEL